MERFSTGAVSRNSETGWFRDLCEPGVLRGCLIDRNHRLVESAGLLLAVFNGVRRSGTGATVSYARKLGREIIMIDPLSREISHTYRNL